MAELASLLNPVTTVVSSGASVNIALNPLVYDPVVDIVLDANCAITLSATPNGRRQTVELWLRQDATAGRLATLPNVAWPGGYQPQLNTRADRFDVLQFATINGTDWTGSVVIGGAVRSYLTTAVQSETIYGGEPMTISGAYVGTPPTNFDVSFNGDAWSTIAAGSATILNGAYSFAVAAPAAGAHSIRIRATNTRAPGPVVNFTVATGAPAGVSAPTHYLSSSSSRNAYADTGPPTNEGADGYLDIAIWVKPDDYSVSSTLLTRWASNNAAKNNARYFFSLTAEGKLFLAWFQENANSDFGSATSSVAITANPATTPVSATGIWLRVQINVGSTARNTAAGSAVATIQPGQCIFSAAKPTSAHADSNGWTQVGATVAGLPQVPMAAATPLAAVGTLGASSVLNGRVYKAVARNASNTIVYNPDFTGLTTGTTSFDDTAPTPVAWVATAGGIA